MERMFTSNDIIKATMDYHAEQMRESVLRMTESITKERIKMSNDLCKQSLRPIIYRLLMLTKKSQFFANLFKIRLYIQPLPLLESQLIHERLILDCNGIKAGEREFIVQDKRKIAR